MRSSILSNKWILIAAFMLAAGGYLIPFWPIEVAGIIIASFAGSRLAAPALGLLLDIAYGAPTGLAQYLFFPFTLGALAALLLRYVGSRYVVERFTRERL
jgi:hypothetical protein